MTKPMVIVRVQELLLNYHCYTRTMKCSLLPLLLILLFPQLSFGQCSAVLTPTNPTCAGACDGSITATPAGGTAPYNYQWFDGLGNPIGGNTPTINGLCAGNYSVTITDAGGGGTTFFTEDFGTGCNQNNNANGTATANGVWTVTDVGAPDPATTNSFFISATEAGMGVGNCGDGCLATGGNNRTLHIGNDAGTPASGLFCPTGDCGAAYDASVQSSKRAESPVINCTGQTGISVSLEYIHMGEAGADYGSIWYFDGATWAPILNPVPQVLCCNAFGGPDAVCDGLFNAQGRWDQVTVALPASADNNPNVRIGIQWENDNNNVGTDPSLAVDNIQLSTTGTPCNITENTVLVDPPAPTVTVSNSGPICTGDNLTLNETGGDAVSWSWSTSGGSTITLTTDQSPTATGVVNGETFTVTITTAAGCTANANTTVTVNAPPSLSSAVTNPTCGNTDGAIDVTVSGGSGNFSFSWSSGPTTEDLTNLAPGTYTLTVTDNTTGCTATLSESLSTPGGPTITTVNTTDPTCGNNDGSIEIIAAGGTAPLDYSIDNGTTLVPTNTFNSLGGGTYNIVVQDAAGCQTTTTANLANSVNIAISLVNTVDPSCGIADGQIEVSSTGTGTETYFIDGVNSGTTTLFTGLGPATYELVVSENGCSDTIDVTLTNVAGPTITSSVGTNISCFGANDGTITITATGATTYSIDNGSGPQVNATGSFTGLVPGTYDITVSDAGGCQSVDQVTITEPGNLSFSSSVTNISCFGDTDGSITISGVTGGTPAYTYSIDGGVSFASGANFVNLTAGSYDLVVADANGCNSAVQNVSIVEPGQLTLSEASVDATCFGSCDGSVQITPNGGTAPFTYTWNFGIPGDQNGAASNVCHGTYSVDVVDAAGCAASIVYVINQPENIVFTNIQTEGPGCDPASCRGSITVTATGASNFTLNGVSNVSGVFTGLCAGNYTLIAENTNGCSISETIVLQAEEAPVASFGLFPGEMSLPDHSTSLFNNSTNATNYEWTITGPDFSHATTETEFDIDLPYQGANYQVCLVALNQTSCTDTACSFIEVRDEFTLWVPNTFTPDADEFNNVWMPIVSDVDAQDYDLFVFNRWGEIVFESHDPSIGWDGTFNGRFVQNGTYVWKITLKSIYTDELREYSGHVTMLK